MPKWSRQKDYFLQKKHIPRGEAAKVNANTNRTKSVKFVD